MSDETLDLHAVLARIDRDLAESAKLREETNKFVSEAHKLEAERRKLDRDRWLAPWSLVIALVTGVGLGLVQLAARLLRY